MSFTVKAATGQEDTGARIRQGIPIDMRLDIGDFDRGERVDQLADPPPASPRYLLLPRGGPHHHGRWQVVHRAAGGHGDGRQRQLPDQGLTFVPADDWSAGAAKAAAALPVQLQGRVSEERHRRRDRRSRHHGTGHCRQTPVGCGQHTSTHTTDEDSSGIALSVKGGSHRYGRLRDLSYQIKWASGQGTLTLNGKGAHPGANGLYTVAGGDINKVTVVPAKGLQR